MFTLPCEMHWRETLLVVLEAFALELQSQHTLAYSEAGGFVQMCNTSPCDIPHVS